MENQENDPKPTPPIPTDEEVENEPVPGEEPVPEEDYIKPDDAASDNTIDDEEKDDV